MEELLATLTGLAVPTLASFSAGTAKTNAKIRNNRHDVRDHWQTGHDLLTSRQAIRNRLPLVNDWAVGLGPRHSAAADRTADPVCARSCASSKPV